MKHEILSLINEYSTNKNEMASIERSVVSGRAINARSDLDNRVRNIMRINNIELSNLKIKEFKKSHHKVKSPLQQVTEIEEATMESLPNQHSDIPKI